MQVEIKYAPSSTVAICNLLPNETLIAEGGCFMALNGDVDFTTTTKQKSGGGIIRGIKRMLSGESFFLNHFKAKSNSVVWLGSPLPGDILVHPLNNDKLIISSGGFVACTEGVEIDLQWQGFRSMFSGEGLFWVNAKGNGSVILNSFGFIYSIDVDGEYICDTSHIVAFENSLEFKISKASQSWWQAFISGEGFVCRFSGRGRVWCQSHNPTLFGRELTPFLRPRKR